ncbi:hypothetical protein HOY82DRAFT_365069 [Tuber indicum]|nr:hypothetical protein HOY82DRAFT_365069 [Tuber indicum]
MIGIPEFSFPCPDSVPDSDNSPRVAWDPSLFGWVCLDVLNAGWDLVASKLVSLQVLVPLFLAFSTSTKPPSLLTPLPSFRAERSFLFHLPTSASPETLIFPPYFPFFLLFLLFLRVLLVPCFFLYSPLYHHLRLIYSLLKITVFRHIIFLHFSPRFIH